jgi:drug/metabolite transporter (DMT)-like permease
MPLLHDAHLRLFSGAVLISFSPVFVNLVSVAPTTSAFYRVAIGGAGLALFALLTGRRFSFTAKAVSALLLAALFFSLDLWFWHRSIRYIGPGLSTLLANLQVFFMMGAGVLLLGQRPALLQIGAACLAVVGLTMIVGADWLGSAPGFRLGVLLGLLTALSYAAYMLAMRRARLEAPDRVPVREVAAMSLVAAVLLGSAALIEGQTLAITAAADAGWLLAYGLLSHAVGVIFIASSLDKVTTSETGIALLLQPALSFVWDVLIFGRSVTFIEGAGALITLLAIYLGAVRRRPHGDSPRARIQ